MSERVVKVQRFPKFCPKCDEWLRSFEDFIEHNIERHGWLRLRCDDMEIYVEPGQLPLLLKLEEE